MGVGVLLSLNLQLVKLFIIGFVVTVQGSQGSILSPSPAFAPAIHPRGETLGHVHHGQSWRSNAPSSPADPYGFVLSPNPSTLPVNPSPRTIAPSSLEVPNGSFSPTPVSSPIPSISPGTSPTTITLSPPHEAAPISATDQGNAPPLPSIQPSPPQRKVPPVRPPEPSPISPAQPPEPFGKLPNNSPVSQPIEHGSFPPMVEKRNASKSVTPDRISPAPTAVPSTKLPKFSPVSQPVENGSFPPNIHIKAPKKGHSLKPIAPAPVAVSLPEFPPSQPHEHGSLPPTVHKQEPVSQAPVALPPATLPENSPVSQPIHQGSFPPNVHNRTVNKGHTNTPTTDPVSPNSSASPPSKTENNHPIGGPVLPKITPSISPAQVTPPKIAHPISPPPFHPVIPAVSPSKLPAPVVSPTLTPSRRSNWKSTGKPVSAPLYKTPKPLPAIVHSSALVPVASPPVNLPENSPANQPIHQGSFPPNVHNRTVNKGHANTPTTEPVSPIASPPSKMENNHPIRRPVLPKVTPSISPAQVTPPKIAYPINPPPFHPMIPAVSPSKLPVPVASPPVNLPENSPVSQPIHQGSLAPVVHNRTENKGHIHTQEPASTNFLAPPPWKMENNQPVGSPVFPKITPSISPAQVAPPPFHPVIPTVSPSKLPAPVVSPALTPSGSFNWKRNGEPVLAPLYKVPKPLPAVVHSPVQAPAVHNSRQFHHASVPPVSSPKSSSNKEYHSPASPPLTTSYNHHYTRSIAASPAPTSSYFVSPPTSVHGDHPIPPSSLPTTGRTHHASPPSSTGPSVSPFAFPVTSPASQVSPAPSPSFIISPHPTKILFNPPKVSPSRSPRSPSESPKKPILPQIHTLPPPPPNEDCLSTICSEPYTNSPPGAPCRCVLPMRVGLRLGVSLYTFFPLVSELASEIAAGVSMTQSQVRIMGAEAASQDPDKTDALIFLVPTGEGFDHTTALLNSERFWQKKVAIKSSYFGSYEVLYVSYPGLPPSPPIPPSSISMIDGGPYSNNGNNGRMIKPLGVDIQKRQHKGGLSRGIIAIIALSVLLAVVLLLAAVLALFKYRHHVSQPTSTPRVSPRSIAKTQGTTESLAAGGLASASSSFRSSIAAYKGSAKTFSANDIEKATDNFNDSRILGEGGFGRVYSGIFEDGTKAAVKVLKREDHHGDREFLAEVEMLSRLHHRNLVKLIGICTEVSFRCLVYELIPNGSVESHLHGVDRENSPLDWSARIKIALGAARGLAYLHEDSSPPVIHRDFKSSNILLEDDFTPKVSDFGLARTAADEENRHISTRVMGTFGYVAPEYAMTGHLLVKSDVYSYGVVLLELLTGRKPVDMSQAPGQENLVAWARPLLTNKEGLEAIIDPSLGTDVPWDSVAKVAAIASMCVQPEVSDRPFMGEVVQALKLVSNECDEAKEAGTRNPSQEDLSVDLDNVSSQLPDHFQRLFSAANYASGSDIEKGLSSLEMFSSSARFRRQDSGSFRRHSYSGPLRTGRSQRLWQVIGRLSGSVSEHRTISKL
ncbi:hypothetical protein PIB30_058433 [Stylosanthes scabra]|uniref:Protein kinase domain-containing protein n=1 Tax=Stylosanthes scabra TaxID=79078 RepID=A0ABU6ZIN7_9FABA|nr:hypothetical protein [Stylosanthes scabra]